MSVGDLSRCLCRRCRLCLILRREGVLGGHCVGSVGGRGGGIVRGRGVFGRFGVVFVGSIEGRGIGGRGIFGMWVRVRGRYCWYGEEEEVIA